MFCATLEEGETMPPLPPHINELIHNVGMCLGFASGGACNKKAGRIAPASLA